MVTMYTDGSCHGNPGPGGYAAILLTDGIRREVQGGDWYTTCSRMELMAVIAGLRLLDKPYEVCIRSDSRYVTDAIKFGRINAFADDATRKNNDLWRILARLSSLHSITAEWVKGHAGNKFNQRCDSLANQQASIMEREQGIRLKVFKVLLANGWMTQEKTAEKVAKDYGATRADYEKVQKYYRMYFDKLHSQK